MTHVSCIYHSTPLRRRLDATLLTPSQWAQVTRIMFAVCGRRRLEERLRMVAAAQPRMPLNTHKCHTNHSQARRCYRTNNQRPLLPQLSWLLDRSIGIDSNLLMDSQFFKSPQLIVLLLRECLFVYTSCPLRSQLVTSVSCITLPSVSFFFLFLSIPTPVQSRKSTTVWWLDFIDLCQT